MKDSKLKIDTPKDNLDSLKIAVVSTYWNQEIIKPMLHDCQMKLKNFDVDPKIFTVPGAYELPFIAKKLANTFDAIILLGCIIKGETPHFEIISKSISDKVLEVSLEEDTPIIFGVLTTNDEAQAIERAAYKGSEFATSAISFLDTIKKVK
tara:strand:+ start:768 stop:1220 length:453 start_codon:yes stop_codon:yes gene_type:complete